MATSRFRVSSLGSRLPRSVARQACLALVVLATGCSEAERVSTPVSPSPPANRLDGAWSGVFTGLAGVEGNGQLTLTLDHRRIDDQRGVLFGTWRLTTPNGAILRAGTVSGTVQGSRAEVQLAAAARRDCNPPVLPFALLVDGFFLSVVASSTQMSGTVTAYSCTDAVEAPVVLAR